ncbi:MAG: esterase family protein [Candidatus Dormibacteraeota bacterium]|nr:esterase family protein [Candidatus Dormibacteraeota bacterium]MBV8446178.1 esterase family protein [Candidatus Dormibacteraeota bacterium]
MRQYMKQWSAALQRDMEILRFGERGVPLIAFPTSMGRFYQWEDFGLVDAVRDRIDAGHVQLWCVDSVDGESWYANWRSPADRIRRAEDYERYILHEVSPQTGSVPVLAGPSFGAFHAALMALRQPASYRGFIGLSGAYSTSHWLNGYFDESVYFNDPLMFVPNLGDEAYLGPMRGWAVKAIVTGRDDANSDESIRLGEALLAKGVGVDLDVWNGWAHDWPYWKRMLHDHV